MDFFSQLINAIFGKPDATRIGRAVRGFLLAVLSSLLTGITDVLAQLLSELSSGGDLTIDWYLVLRTMAITTTPTIIAWLVGLAAYLKGLAEQK